MTTISKRLAALAIGFAVVMPASPSFAQPGENDGRRARDAAIHDCSVKSEKYFQNGWGVTQLTIYRVCMVQEGQQQE